MTFGYFVREIYERVLNAPLTEPKVLVLLACGAVFFYILLDWLDTRELTVTYAPYGGYARFFLDLGVAFLSFGALWSAAHGRRSTAFFLSLVAISGSVWAMTGLGELKQGKAATTEHRQYLQLVRFSHLVGGVALLSFWMAMRYFEMDWMTRQNVAIFVALIAVFLIVEELLARRVEICIGPRLPGDFIRNLLGGFISQRKPEDKPGS